MVHKLSIAVGIAAALQSVVAQEPAKPPMNPFPATNQTNLPFLLGQNPNDYQCTPWGPGSKWNNTWYPPCRLQSEYEIKCMAEAVIPEGATQEQKVEAWEKQRKCLCVDNPDFFHVAAYGCIGCKSPKGYNLEPQKHVDAYRVMFNSLANEGYCKGDATLKGDYKSYYDKAFAGTNINYANVQMPTPKEPFTVPVSEYWERPDNYIVNKPEAANASTEGTANLSPVIEYGIAVAPAATNSSKFAASNKTISNVVSIVKCLNLAVKFNKGEQTVQQVAEPQVFVNPLSIPTEQRNEIKVSLNIMGIPVVRCSSATCADQKTQQAPKALPPSAGNDGAAAPAPVGTTTPGRVGGDGADDSSTTAMTVDGQVVEVKGNHALVGGKKCRVVIV